MKVRILEAAVATMVMATIVTAASADVVSTKAFHNKRGGETTVTKDRGQNGVVTDKHVTTGDGRTIDTKVVRRGHRSGRNEMRPGKGAFVVRKTRTVTRPDGSRMTDIQKRSVRPNVIKRSHTRTINGKIVLKKSTVRHRRHIPAKPGKHHRYGRRFRNIRNR